jgi:hypothetical protein
MENESGKSKREEWEEEQTHISELIEADGVEGHGGRGDDAENRQGDLGGGTFHECPRLYCEPSCCAVCSRQSVRSPAPALSDPNTHRSFVFLHLNPYKLLQYGPEGHKSSSRPGRTQTGREWAVSMGRDWVYLVLKDISGSRHSIWLSSV